MAAVRVTGLTKSYEEGGQRHLVLDGVDLALARGERVALLGRSGSGKSTLLHVLAGLDRADAGRVVVDDVDVTALDERARTIWRRNTVGLVFQFFNLLPTLTVEENVLLPLELAGRRVDRAARARAGELLEAVGLADRRASAPDALSGGEQQRVAVARALVHAPRLVLADEPTGNLDDESARVVLGLFVDLARAANATVLIVTHSQEVARATDRALRLVHGKLRGAEDERR